MRYDRSLRARQPVGGPPFTPLYLFRTGAQGVWYDPSDFSTLFQDAAGTIPVTSVEQPVGLMLDKSKGLVLGPELVTNGSFSAGTAGWASGNSASLSVVGGRLRIENSAALNGHASQNIQTVIGRAYQIQTSRFASPNSRVSYSSTGVQYAGDYGFTTTPLSGVDRRTIIATSTSLTVVAYVNSSVIGNAVELDDVSVREIPGNHATQSTLTSRPILGVQPNTGVRNILVGSALTASPSFWLSNQTQNGLTSVKVNQGIDIDGLPFCDYRFTGTATNNFMDAVFFNSLTRVPTVSGQTFTTSAFCQLIGGTAPVGAGFRVGVVEETSPNTYLGVSTQPGTVSDTQSLHSASRTISTGNQARIAFSLSVVPGETVDVTYRVKAAQFEIGSSRTAFQFNYSNLNITEPGIPGSFYLACDGIDDGMSTANIDFTATDAVTFCTGLRRLLDTESSLFEFSTGSAFSTNGSFAFYPRAPGGGAGVLTFRSRGTQTSDTNTSPLTTPSSTIASGQARISTDLNRVRINAGGDVVSTGDQGTGNYGNYPLYLFRRGGTSFPFNGRFYGLVIVGNLLNDSQLRQLEMWMNRKTGAF